MHHGYYAKGRPQKTNTEAQVDMIEEILDWAGVKRVRQVCSRFRQPDVSFCSKLLQ